MSYADLSTRAQVSRQRAAALQILRRYPIEVEGLRLLQHDFNTTFRVDTADRRRFALRINVNSKRSLEHVTAEVSWVEALARDTSVHVAVPQRTTDGERTVLFDHPDLGRTVTAVLYSWLEGRLLGDKPTLRQVRGVGRLAAELHTHAETWKLPAGASLSLFQGPLLDSPSYLDDDHELLTTPRRAVIAAAMAEVTHRMDALFARQVPIPLHADLHGWNLKWHDGGLAVFDFDDSGLGLPVQDLAMAAYYLRDEMVLEQAMLEGYNSVRPLPSFSAAEYEAIVAGRNLVLLNDVLVTNTAEHRAFRPRYVANSITKLCAYLDTGVYRHEVDGLIPAGE